MIFIMAELVLVLQHLVEVPVLKCCTQLFTDTGSCFCGFAVKEMLEDNPGGVSICHDIVCSLNS